MATLTEVSKVARKAIKFSAIGLVVLMILPFVFRAASKWWLNLNPTPPPPPTVVYGKLPNLNFPTSEEIATPEYKLETISGFLPSDLPTVGRVYVVGVNKSRLVSLDRIRGIARTLGFTTELAQLDNQNFKFVHQNLPAELRFNIITWQFAYRFDGTSDKEVYVNKAQNPQGNPAIGEARDYFQKIGLLPADLVAGIAKYKYLAATNSALVPTESFYESGFTRVDLFRADKDKLKVLTPEGDSGSPVNIIFSGVGGQKRVLQANYYYSMTVDNDFGTYPLKTVQEAYNELVQGQGFVARRASTKVTIRRASLAYYESAEPQNFLQPIFVFEGDGNFMGYVQAVKPEYLETAASQNTPNQ